jgi:hypothetical protein
MDRDFNFYPAQHHYFEMTFQDAQAFLASKEKIVSLKIRPSHWLDDKTFENRYVYDNEYVDFEALLSKYDKVRVGNVGRHVSSQNHTPLSTALMLATNSWLFATKVDPKSSLRFRPSKSPRSA